MSKKNKSGKTWKQHAGPYLSRALKQASKSWKPKSARTDPRKVKKLRDQRTKINDQIRAELNK